jgi:uncharacterized membrane protein
MYIFILYNYYIMDYLVPAFTMISLDSIYLSQLGGPLFNPMVKNIQNSSLKVNIYGAAIVYILMLFVIYRFIIKERKSPQDAFLLGFCIYGIFDFTNYAIFKDYEIIPATVDMIWGGLLFYTTTFVTYKLLGLKI